MPDPIRQAASVAVFCGSRFGVKAAYTEAARATGEGLARAGIRLIYGGGKVGLMGVLADAAIAAGGQVSGVIPHFLSAREVMHEHVADLTVTDSMHSRKQRMFAGADAFLVLPGGLGTFDEAIEIITWRQLRLHDKPIVIVDIDGWARTLLAIVENAIDDGFADPSARALFSIATSVEAALAQLRTVRTEAASADIERL
ncbi:TIGR00730 family Rossman fold protein [Lichenicoccus sp.]|uniref:LOG family protein n=1 Tax=Lichenicoccus sp. TaxID=2781899 RepID=UPI003D102694